MNFIKKLFSKKESSLSYQEFWHWFQIHEKTFYQSVQNQKNIEKEFFNPLSKKLNQVKDGYFYLTGMYDKQKAELILSAEGNIKHFFFVEALVEAAPELENWKFTALKPPSEIENTKINMGGYTFHDKNLFFYANEDQEFPDDINISVIHSGLNESNKNEISHGIYIFLDNYLGEFEFADHIDDLQIVSPKEAKKEWVPIEKLKNYIQWRQKEFIEKYEGIFYEKDEDDYTLLEGKMSNGNKIITVVNARVLKWDRKASHPWISIFNFTYDGNQNNGMPNEKDYRRMDEIEEEIINGLKEHEGNIYIGRQTGNNEREIFFASRDFRKISQVLHEIEKKHKNSLSIEYDIYKDKYWRRFEAYNKS